MSNGDVSDLIETIASIGKSNPSFPELHRLYPFKHYYLPDHTLDRGSLDERDGLVTRRELLLRFLVLNAVIDQGPELLGVRELLYKVTNDLYLREIRFLHKPLSFFQELGIAIDRILTQHESVKSARAEIWAADNQSNASRYNLFIDNSRQVLSYAVFRWGVPLALPLLLEKDNTREVVQPFVLLDYLQSWPSSEEMSQQLKDNERYGLGKAIGDKACHLFTKWMVSSFRLTQRLELSWGDLSYEVPYDSNAGRVLWRTGYLLKWSDEKSYISRQVVQPGAGKGGANYIRVTNIRDMKATTELSSHYKTLYDDISINFLKSHKRTPKKVAIQRIQHAYLLDSYHISGLGVAEFDEGLIHIGTNYCFNHSDPLCDHCPVNHLCEGFNINQELINNYRT